MDKAKKKLPLDMPDDGITITGNEGTKLDVDFLGGGAVRFTAKKPVTLSGPNLLALTAILAMPEVCGE